MMRINKFISSNSKYSRREADSLIKQGKVKLNGKPINLGTQIDPDKDEISVNGEKIVANEEKIVYIALNKPINFITTRKDEEGRRTIMELVPDIKNLKPIGRLDRNTEGLLLLSNDGEYINKMTHPKYECEKEYKAVIYGNLTEEKRIQLEKGVIIEGKKTSPCIIKILERRPDETLLTITIHEGRNRQIRKMFDCISVPVKYLQRIRIGNIHLGNLQKGCYKIINIQ
ncbi:MAG: pseudouridine synthase [Candidatus Gracilibacteria bacterium]